MRIAVLNLAPSSESLEIAALIQQAGMEVFDFSLGDLLENHNNLDAFVFAGDSAELESSTVAQSLSNFLKDQYARGKIILGLGIGAAKILAEQGLIPGLYNDHVGLEIKLSADRRGEGPGKLSWIRLSENYQLNAFTLGLSPHEILPLRQGVQAQFLIPPGLLLEMQAQGQTVFLFCDAAGRLLPEPSIAAVSNKTGRVLALLAQPEPLTLGRLFQALKAELESAFFERVDPLYYWPRK